MVPSWHRSPPGLHGAFGVQPSGALDASLLSPGASMVASVPEGPSSDAELSVPPASPTDPSLPDASLDDD
jgi:hypothetical protein